MPSVRARTSVLWRVLIVSSPETVNSIRPKKSTASMAASAIRSFAGRFAAATRSRHGSASAELETNRLSRLWNTAASNPADRIAPMPW